MCYLGQRLPATQTKNIRYHVRSSVFEWEKQNKKKMSVLLEPWKYDLYQKVISLQELSKTKRTKPKVCQGSEKLEVL